MNLKAVAVVAMVIIAGMAFAVASGMLELKGGGGGSQNYHYTVEITTDKYAYTPNETISVTVHSLREYMIDNSIVETPKSVHLDLIIAGLTVFTGDMHSPATFTYPASQFPRATDNMTVDITASVQATAPDTGNLMLATGYGLFLVSASALSDIAPPTIISTSPANDESNVVANTIIQIQFDEAINVSSVSASTIYLTTGTEAGTHYANPEYKVFGSMVTLKPMNLLTYNTYYWLHITVGVSDLSGNPMSANLVTHFKTLTSKPRPEYDPPWVTGVSWTSSLFVIIKFNEGVSRSFMTSQNIVLVDPNGRQVLGTLDLSDYNKISFMPYQSESANILHNATYRLTVNGITDTYGNAMTVPYTASYTTPVAPNQTKQPTGISSIVSFLASPMNLLIGALLLIFGLLWGIIGLPFKKIRIVPIIIGLFEIILWIVMALNIITPVT